MGKNNNRTRGNVLAMVSLNGTGAAAADKAAADLEAARINDAAAFIESADGAPIIKAAKESAAEENAAAESLSAADIAAKMAALPVYDSPKSVKEVTTLLAEYLKGDEIKELGKLSGGALMNQVIMKFYAVTGKGLTKIDLAAILKASGNNRTNVNGHLQIFAKSKDSERRPLCPKGLNCWKEDGRYCIERIIPKAAEVSAPEAVKA